MKRISLILIAALVLPACAGMSGAQKGAVVGAGTGAVGGAIIGALGGAAAGALIGDAIEKKPAGT